MDLKTRTGKTVIICDTEPVAIQGLSTLLDRTPEFRILGKTVSLTVAAGMVQEFSPTVAVIDRAFGLAAVSNWLATLRGSGRPTATVVWGANIAETEVPQLVRAGACGIVRKTADLETLLSCVQKAASGRTCIQDFVIHSRTVVRPCISRLTDRERQVLALVEEGMRNKDIASFLGIEPGTVKIHLRNIFSKTGTHRRTELMLAGLEEKTVLTLPTI